MEKITLGMEVTDKVGQVWIVGEVGLSYVIIWGKTFCAEEKLTWKQFEGFFK